MYYSIYELRHEKISSVSSGICIFLFCKPQIDIPCTKEIFLRVFSLGENFKNYQQNTWQSASISYCFPYEQTTEILYSASPRSLFWNVLMKVTDANNVTKKMSFDFLLHLKRSREFNIELYVFIFSF